MASLFADLIPAKVTQGSAQGNAPAVSLFADLIPAKESQGSAQSNAPAASLFADLIPESTTSPQGLSPSPAVVDEPVTVGGETAGTVTSPGFRTGFATDNDPVREAWRKQEPISTTSTQMLDPVIAQMLYDPVAPPRQPVAASTILPPATADSIMGGIPVAQGILKMVRPEYLGTLAQELIGMTQEQRVTTMAESGVRGRAAQILLGQAADINAKTAEDDAAGRQTRRDFSVKNPLIGALAAGGADTLKSAINIPSAAADLFNQTFVNPPLQLFGADKLGRVGYAPGTDYLTKAQSDFMPADAKLSLADAIKKEKFGSWFMQNMSAQLPQIAQSVSLAMNPAIRAALLPSMGAQEAAQAYTSGDDSRVAAVKGTVATLAEMLPLKAFDAVRDRILAMPLSAGAGLMTEAAKRVMASGAALTVQSLTGGIEEALTEIGKNTADNIFTTKTVPTMQNVPEATVIGAGIGGGMATPNVATALTQGDTNSPAAQIARAIQEGVDGTTFTQDGIKSQAVASLNPDNAQMRSTMFDDLVPKATTPANPTVSPDATAAATPQSSTTTFSQPAPTVSPVATPTADPTVTYSGIAAPTATNAPAAPVEPVEPPKPATTRPGAIQILSVLSDLNNGGDGLNPSIAAWLTANGFVNYYQPGTPALTPSGQSLLMMFQTKNLTTAEAEANIDALLPPAPVTPVAPAPTTPADPIVTTPVAAPATPAPTQQVAPDATQRVSTVSGRQVDTKWRIVDASELIAASGDLQPRDRSRASSDEQINLMASTLDPQRLAGSAEADRGSPIIGSDMVVESGNGRVMAIRRAFDMFPEQAKQYGDYLRSLGFNIDGLKTPVLVRERTTPMTQDERIQFVRESNQAATMALTPVERAEIDSSAMNDGVVSLWRGGDISDVANADFVAAFVGELPQTQRNDMMDANGRLSPDGVVRVRRALLSAAYSDRDLLSQLVESADDNTRGIGNALFDTAGEWLKMRRMAEAGVIDRAYDVTKDLVSAARIVSQLRNQKQNVNEWLNQNDLMDERNPIVDAFVKGFYNPQITRAAGRESINDVLRTYATMAMAQDTAGMFNDNPTPAQIADGAVKQRNENERKPEQTGLFSDSVADVGQGVQRGGGSAQAGGVQGDRSRTDRQSQQSSSNTAPSADRGRTQNETQTGSGDQTESSQVNETLNGTPTYRPEGAAGRTTSGSALLDQRGAGDEGQIAGAPGEPGTHANTRGTRIGTFVQTVSFTNRVSFYRQAFEDAGLDPAKANNLPIERQFRILSKLLEDTFGLRFVDKTAYANNRKAVDELLDMYRNLQFMAAALELPLKTIGLSGTLGVVSMSKQRYLGVYYPQGLALHSRPSKATPSPKSFTGAFIGLPERTNSFGHEWGHALDFFLQDKFARFGKGGLSNFVRKEGFDPGATSSEDAFKDLVMALFFDEAKTAAKVMELERRIATTQSLTVAATLQTQLDAIRAGSTQVDSKSEYFRRVQQLGNPRYYLQPTEMIARSFEVYISGKIEALGSGTEAITKSISAYGNVAVEYMANAYPQQAERLKINLAWENLFDALRAESVMSQPGDAIATVPADTNIIDPLEMLKTTPDYRGAVRRELDGWVDFADRWRKKNTAPQNPKGVMARASDQLAASLWSDRGALLMMMARYPQSEAVRNLVKKLTTDPGSSRLNNTITLEDSIQKQVNIYSLEIGNIAERYKLDKLTPAQNESLRLELVSHSDGQLTPELIEAADKIRNLFNSGWYYGDNAGLKMGYARNGYLPRMIDKAQMVTDPDGFVDSASRVYNVMFDTDFGNYDTDPKQLHEMLTRGQEIVKMKDFAPRAVGLSSADKTLVNAAIKQLNIAYKAQDAATKDTSGTPDAQDKADREMEEARLLASGVYDAIRTADGSINGAEWLRGVWLGGLEVTDSGSPDADFTKGRVLPPETDVLMRKFMITHIPTLMADYFPALIRKAEYQRRFGGDFVADMKRDMYAQGVLPDDIQTMADTLNRLAGRASDESMGKFAQTVSTMQAYGIMAMLGRAAISAIAEPLTAAIQTRDLRQAVRSLYVTLAQFLPTATARDREALAGMVGLISNPFMDQMLSHREGGDFSNNPKLSKMMARYFVYTLQHGYMKASSIGALSVSQSFIRNRMDTLRNARNKNERARAIRDLRELGLQPSDDVQFAEWLSEKDANGDSIEGGRRPTAEEMFSDMGKVYSDMLYRMSRKMILDPKPTDTAVFAKSTLGRMVMSIQAFSYTFQRQVMIASAKKIAEEYESSGSVYQTAKVTSGVVLGFGALVAAQTLTSLLREMIFNPDKLDEMEEEERLSYLLKLGVSRAGLAGAFDPILNMFQGLRYSRDLNTTMNGAVLGYFGQALQQMITPLVRNSDKTNTAEYNAITGAYQLIVIPVIARALTTLPTGAFSTLATAALYSALSSPQARKDVAEFFVGQKPAQARRTTRGVVSGQRTGF